MSVRGFCPFNGLRSTPNHFESLPGLADKTVYPYPPSTLSPSSLLRRRAVRSSLQPYCRVLLDDYELTVLLLNGTESEYSSSGEYMEHARVRMNNILRRSRLNSDGLVPPLDVSARLLTLEQTIEQGGSLQRFWFEMPKVGTSVTLWYLH